MTSTPRRTIWWEGAGEARAAVIIDQRQLPRQLVLARWTRLEDAVTGIADMAVRGAPLIGVAAAHGMALAARTDASDTALRAAGAALVATRPTAVNLPWAVDRCLTVALARPEAERAECLAQLATEIADEDAAACRRIGEAGLQVLMDLAELEGTPLGILTHCNAGRLACVEWGTATAPVYLAHEAGLPVHVWVSETRPRNQGAALTAWELADAGIPHTLIVDNAADLVIRKGLAQVVIVGADRVAANGDTANKVGTVLKAYAAAEHASTFLVALPWSTYDRDCPSGEQIPIEERSPDEVLYVNGAPIAPPGTVARNWAFDVTPAKYVHGYLTPDGCLTAAELREHAPPR